MCHKNLHVAVGGVKSPTVGRICKILPTTPPRPLQYIIPSKNKVTELNAIQHLYTTKLPQNSVHIMDNVNQNVTSPSCHACNKSTEAVTNLHVKANI